MHRLTVLASARASTLAFLLIMAGSASVGSALANDSTAELAAGGLVLKTTPDIEMRSEDLYLSTKEVVVTYRFFNRSFQDQTVTVAFPMPDIRLDFINGMTSAPYPESKNFLGFSTKIDGKAVPTGVEEKAFANDADQTALLKQLGIPLYPDSEYKGLMALPKDQQERLVRLGLADEDESTVNGKTERRVVPGWTVKTTYHFQASFPAGRQVTIVHRYTPAVGSSIGTGIGEADAATDPEFKSFLDRNCVEPSFVDAVKHAKNATRDGHRVLVEKRLGYILHTGANWAAPIHDFRLVVDKGDPETLVSFCGDGIKKISPTKFEMRKTDFSPRDDLNVLMIRSIPQ